MYAITFLEVNSMDLAQQKKSLWRYGIHCCILLEMVKGPLNLCDASEA